jgi:hypothetical protein
MPISDFRDSGTHLIHVVYPGHSPAYLGCFRQSSQANFGKLVLLDGGFHAIGNVDNQPDCELHVLTSIDVYPPVYWMTR